MIAFIVFFTQFTSAIHGQVYPNTFITFRDTVYLQSRSAHDLLRFYTAAKRDITDSLTGAAMYLALARCEYLMGIAYKTENKTSEAAAYFEQGITWSENSLAAAMTSEGYLLLGSGISFICQINTSYGLRNHRKIEENAQRSLEINPDNLMAQHLMASFYILAPWPIGNVQRGERMLREILNHNYLSLSQDDLFNIYLILQAACLKQRKNQEALLWQQRGEALYPTNNFISMLVK